MKKGIVALLLALALVVMISPGIVGRLAERSMDENLDWAAAESQELVVTSQGFDRGWFSSEGRHRIEFRDGELRGLLLAYSDSNDIPALIIDTRLDHGLIALSSMSRDKGSLAPGLGSAVSTLSIESSNGKTIPLPGTIYSKVSLTGELHSNYVLETGSFEHNGATAYWDNIDFLVTTSPSSGDVGFSGSIGSFAMDSLAESIRINKVSFSGEQQPSPYGFRVGPLEASIESIVFEAAVPQTITSIEVNSMTAIDGDRVNASALLKIESAPFAELGYGSLSANIRIKDADGQSVGNIKHTLENLPPSTAAGSLPMQLEADAQRLLASGLEFHIDEAIVDLPQGPIRSELHLVVDESDIDSFAFTSLLLAVDAEAEFSLSAELMDLAAAADPQANAAVGMGFLRKTGDVYELQAEFKKGLLTVNGAPMPLPWQ